MAAGVADNLGMEAIACGPGVDWYALEGAMLPPLQETYVSTLRVGDGGAVFIAPQQNGRRVVRGDGSRWVEVAWSDAGCRVTSSPTALSTVFLPVAADGDLRVVLVVDGFVTTDVWLEGAPSFEVYLPVGTHSLRTRTMAGWDNQLGPERTVSVTVDGPNRFEVALPAQGERR
jgi:hypothetical protein